jgi:hypothetical protein
VEKIVTVGKTLELVRHKKGRRSISASKEPRLGERGLSGQISTLCRDSPDDDEGSKKWWFLKSQASPSPIT